MKKIIYGIFICLIALTGISTIAWAEDTPTVIMNDDSDEFVYFNGSADDFGNSFKNMAPGDERTQNIIIRNDKVTTLKVYFSVEVLKDLVDEDIKGAVYFVTLSKNGNPFYKGVLGGDNGTLKDLSDGSVDERVLLAKLSKDQQSTVSMTITFDGETMDNEYQGKTGELQFNFDAEEYTEKIDDDNPPFGPGTEEPSTEPGKTNEPGTTPSASPASSELPKSTDKGKLTPNSTDSTTIDDNDTPNGNSKDNNGDDKKTDKGVKTGDITKIGIFVGLLLASIGIIAAALYYNKKKQNGAEV